MLALAAVAASGTAVVLALRCATYQTREWEARSAQQNAERASALTANELGEVRSRLGRLVDERDAQIKSLEHQLMALDGMRRVAVDRIGELLSDDAARTASDRYLAGTPVPDKPASDR